jgi:hypothetical protein
LRILKNVNTIVRAAGTLTLPFVIALGAAFLRHPRAEKEKAAEPVLASKSSGDNM